MAGQRIPKGFAGLFFLEGKEMEKWEPIFWIFGSGIAFFIFLLLFETLRANRRKKS
jgi:hypothetical protein